MLFGKKASGGPAWLLVCLGNPGDRFEGTRHNAGFMTADALEHAYRTPINKLKNRALTGLFTFGEEKVLVMKPMTFMNLSGEAVGPTASFYKIPPERVLVISDDTDLPLGKLRVRRGGSAGGHNGLKSIIQHLGTDQFPRVKVGVGGKPHPDYDMADWVLSRFQGEDKAAMEAAVQRAAEAAECYITKGADEAMNRYNR